MFNIGGGEMVAVVLLALLLFGPKELPKIARTIGKAMAEFRRAQNDLKSTFHREMANLERESGVKEIISTNYLAQSQSYNYDDYNPEEDHSYYDGGASYDTTNHEADASATEGVEHIPGPLQIEAAADTVPHGHVYEAEHAEAGHAEAVESLPPAHTESGQEPVHT
ncbi:MAG TPA: twin-arginine translocase TatA/TatE family subunit [Bryobacteraceae bacterium]|nr:twin-arginine translocase TatA/TatE family subunit [Bryobacteraceae bacterium]